MSELPFWATEEFWRKVAIWVTAGMFVILIILTFDSVAVITAGSERVPAYSVINNRIYYRMDRERGFQAPVIGDEAPLFGKKLTEEEAAAMVSHGKLTVQAKNCMNCHTLLGNGAYFAPDLTKAWLDPAWGNEGQSRIDDGQLPAGSGNQCPRLRHRPQNAGPEYHGRGSEGGRRLSEMDVFHRHDGLSRPVPADRTGR